MENTNESEQKVETTDKMDKTEVAETNSNDGKPEIDVISEAKKIQEEMKKENDRKQKLLEREEKLLARQETLRALGGGSPAGQPTEKPKEKTAKEYADEVMAGKIKAN